MTRVERLVAKFRSQVSDIAEPYLWSDDEVLDYIDAVQKQVCQKDGGISDSNSELTRVPIEVNEPWADIDNRILKIRYVERESDNREIEIVNFEDVQNRPLESHGTYTRLPTMSSLFNDTRTGQVRAVVTNMEQDRVRWVYVPEVADVARLIVFRLPLETISVDTVGQVDLEIHPRHDEHLVSGMKMFAYGKEDAEAFDKAKKQEHELAFMGYCEQIRLERERREHKHRSITYGGI
jgi:hypothetical protein